MKKPKIDLFIIIPLMTVVFMGLLSLKSSLFYNPSKFFVQLVWVFLAFIVFVIISRQDLRFWERVSGPMFIANIVLLILVLIIGKKIGGSRRWLDIGFMNFQISELSKLSIIILTATRLNRKPTPSDGYTFLDLAPEAMATLLTMFLIYKEPDLGTSLLIMMTVGIMMLSSKINRKNIIAMIISLIIIAPLAWNFGMRSYQKTRIKAIVNMMVADDSSKEMSQTSQYHTKQSIIAIGSGGLKGKGYMKGTQNMLRFVPEHHTDFIFSVYAEEFGFYGSVFLMILYFIIFARSIMCIKKAEDKFSALLIIGSVALLWFQVVINIGMVSGVMPVVGIPLPFFSYGGSSLLANTILIAFVHNISTSSSYNKI